MLQCGGAAVASVILKGLDSTGYKAAAGAANQLNKTAGVTIGRGLGFEIILTCVAICNPVSFELKPLLCIACLQCSHQVYVQVCVCLHCVCSHRLSSDHKDYQHAGTPPTRASPVSTWSSRTFRTMTNCLHFSTGSVFGFDKADAEESGPTNHSTSNAAHALSLPVSMLSLIALRCVCRCLHHWPLALYCSCVT